MNFQDVLNGYNGTIMAYGQTGAGKTYTLSCTQKDQLGGQGPYRIVITSSHDK